jgi:hypothetical protein
MNQETSIANLPREAQAVGVTRSFDGGVAMVHARKVTIGGVAALTVAMGFAAAAWACIPVATLNLSPATVKPGDTVTVSGQFYGTKSDVTLHRATIDGPVLATTTPDEDGNIAATFQVPADAAAGSFLIVATQPVVPGATTWGVPSRALVTVTRTGATPAVGAPTAPIADRPATLEHTSSVSTGTLLLTALGVVGIGLFLAGAGAVFAARRPQAATETVQTRR